MGNYLLLFLAWCLYFALHSFMAHEKIKAFAEKYFAQHMRFYRLGFNFISITLIIALFYFQFSLPFENVFPQNIALQISGAAIFGIGLLILLYAFYTFNLSEFFGLQQLKNEINTKSEAQEKKLIKHGMYGYVRHPLYFGVILMLLGALLFLPYYSTLAFVLATYIYLPIGVKLEEDKLINEFGNDYKVYQKEVKMLVPFVY